MIFFVLLLSVTSLTSSQTQYQCRTDDRWPEFLYVVNDTCLRCPSTCETCLPETANLHYPCRTCFIGYGFEPSPTARELLDSSRRDVPIPTDSPDMDKIPYNETEVDMDDPFMWFVSGQCADCHTIGKYPTSGSTRLHLTPASQSTPYEGRLEVYYYHRWWAVCDDLWTMTNTHIACAELGLGLGVSFYYEYQTSLGPVPIAFDNIQCESEETSLFRCQRSDFLRHNCDITETLGIRCSGPRHRSICLDQCPVGQWLDTHTLVCKNCSDTCLTCASHPTICTSCEEPYFLAMNATCVQECPYGYYGHVTRHTCEKCSENCKTCADGSTGSQCLSCDVNLILYKGRCDAHCPGISLWVQQPEGAICVDACPSQYYPTKAFVCKLCSEDCRSCEGLPSNCTECIAGAVLSLDLQEETGESLGRCSAACVSGHFPDALNICQRCAQHTCTDCYLGGEYCKSCQEGDLLQFGRCVKRCEYGLYNSSGVCSDQCPVGQYGELTSGQCRPCQSPCKHCERGHLCTGCFDGYFLFDNHCVQACGQHHLAISQRVESGLRIVGTQSVLEGYVQMRSENVWSFVCFQKLELLSAQFICDSLGIGDILKISYENSLDREGASFVYPDLDCFTEDESFHTCSLQNYTIYSGCNTQTPLLRCSGPDISRENICVRLSRGPCTEDTCSNLSRCVDVSTNESFSYCESCPRGYQGDGVQCEKVPGVTSSVHILFPASDVELLNWPEAVELQLPCVVKDKHHATIHWSHNGEDIGSNTQRRVGEQGLLTLFSPVGLNSSGVYTCVVRVFGEMVDHRSYNITVQERVKITVPPDDYTGSGAVNLNCETRGFPQALVYWTKDGHIVTSGGDRYRQAENGSLIIESVRPEHSGLYQCTARNNFTQDQASATVTVTGQPVIMNKRAEVGAALGQEFTLQCVASGGPNPDIYWKKDSRDIEFTDRVQFVEGDSLQISEVQYSDAGMYKCIARNLFGEDIWITSVHVMEHPNATLSPLYIEDVLGSRVTYLCETSPTHPAPLITWILPARGEFTETNQTLGVEMFDGRLIIADLQEEDAGVIKCRVSNLAGYVVVSAELLVKVPPRFIHSPQNLTELGGWPVHLHWTVYSVPPADITWYHRGQQVYSNTHGVHMNSSGLYLTVFWPDSEGWYSLRATHQVGYLLGSAYLRVIRNLGSLSDLDVTETSITILLEHLLTDGLMADYVEVVMSYLGNATHDIDVSPYEVQVVPCTNTSSCQEPYSSSQVLHSVALLQPSVSQFTVGDGKFYFIDSVGEVYNEMLVSHSWYAVSVRYFTRGKDSSPEMVAATDYTFIFTRTPVVTTVVRVAWRTAVAVFLVLLFLLGLIVLTLYILYKKGYVQKPARLSDLCRKKETEDIDGPIDVESYLPQFSPNPSPTLSNMKQMEAKPSTSYLPTDEEIHQIISGGVFNYGDDRWVNKLSADKPSTSQGVTRSLSDTAVHSGQSTAHPSVVHKLSTGSKDSGSDSGYNENVPRKLSLSSKKGTPLAREVVSVVSLRHDQNGDRVNHRPQQMLPVNGTDRMHKLKLRLARVSAVATGYLSSSMLRIKEKVTSSRRTVTLLDYTDEVKVSQSQVSGVFSTGKQVNSVEVNDRSVPVMTTRRLSKECDSLSECEDNYIDPRSISTVPYHELVSGNMNQDKERLDMLNNSIHSTNSTDSLPDITGPDNETLIHDTLAHQGSVMENSIDNPIEDDEFEIIYKVNKKSLEGQISDLSELEIDATESNYSKTDIVKEVTDLIDGETRKHIRNLEGSSKPSPRKHLNNKHVGSLVKEENSASIENSNRFSHKNGSYRNGNSENIDAMVDDDVDDIVDLANPDDTDTQEGKDSGIYEQVETLKVCNDSDSEMTQKNDTEIYTSADLTAIGGDSHPQFSNSQEHVDNKKSVIDIISRPAEDECEGTSPVTEADEVIEAFNDMLTKVESRESQTDHGLESGGRRIMEAWDGDRNTPTAYQREEHAEVGVRSGSVSHVYTELIADPEHSASQEFPLNNQILTPRIQIQVEEVVDDGSKVSSAENDNRLEIDETSDTLDIADQMNSEPLEATDDENLITKCKEGFLPEEPVRLYYALFPNENSPVFKASEDAMTDSASRVKEIPCRGETDVFTVVVPDRVKAHKLPKTLDLSGTDNSEFLSTYAKIKRSVTMKQSADEKRVRGACIYGSTVASRIYPDHADIVEQVRPSGITDGQQFVMSDAYKNKPPRKLDIPDIFQK